MRLPVFLVLIFSFNLAAFNCATAQQRKFLNVSPSPDATNIDQNRNIPPLDSRDEDDHPANADQRKHGSFHRPNRSMNFHSNGIRKHGAGLRRVAACVLTEQLANGLSTICFYNCHGHQYSLPVDSVTDCAQTVSETGFGQ